MSGKGIDNSAEQLSGNDGGYVIVVTRWNTAIVDGLLGGAMQALRSVGITDNQIRVVTVPGAFEILWPVKLLQRVVIVMRSLHWALSSGVVHLISNMWRGRHARYWRGGPQFGQASGLWCADS